MSVNLTGTIKLIAKIGGVIHDLGAYSAPVLEAITKLREQGPTDADGHELTPAEVVERIEASRAVAQNIAQTAQEELDALPKAD
ncbi:MAG: hypothetical protein AB7H88_22405 [Vicinamibacterales bacterium]